MGGADEADMLRNSRPIASLPIATALRLAGVGLLTTLIALRGRAPGCSAVLPERAGYSMGTPVTYCRLVSW